MYDLAIWSLAVILLAVSWLKDKGKTRKALLKAGKSALNILPELVGIILIIGLILAVFDPQTISSLIGANSGYFGVLLAAVVGAITLIPGFIAFPTAAMLLQSGAGYMQIGAFISTLMMVGVATAPLEIRYFGKRVTLLRNILAFLFSFLVAYTISKVVA